MSTLIKVIREKQAHPERFYPASGCLWKTSKLNHATGEREGGGLCPRHRPAPKFTSAQMVTTGFEFPGGRP
jgi:hypothetical protein